ncbi:MAG TPA: hypothetical protein VFU12_20470 [Glycomyces sp.]|nr:hypothetical protein [Glycomyces sp.]
MKGADLFNAAVLDPGGRRVGMVIDIRTAPAPDRPALVVQGLVIGRRHVRLFGYQRSDEVGPKPLSRISALLHRDTRYAPLADVDLASPGTVRLRVPWDDLDLLADR